MSTEDENSILEALNKLRERKGMRVKQNQAPVPAPSLDVQALDSSSYKRLTIEVLVDNWRLQAQRALAKGSDEDIEIFFQMLDEHADAVRSAAFDALFAMVALGNMESKVQLRAKSG